MNDIEHKRALELLELAIPNGECLECHLVPKSNGYGQVGIAGVNYSAHRLVYTQLVCDPGDLFVLHTCDNPRCIKPGHLYHGTQQDNINDVMARGRKADTTGQNRALGPEAVSYIRAWNGIISQRELATKFRVSQGTINNVITQRRGYYT